MTTYEQDPEPVQRRASKVGSIKRPSSRAGSVRNSVHNGVGPAAPGEVMSLDRQRDLQQSQSVPPSPQQPQSAPLQQQRGVALQDHGAGVSGNRSTTFDENSSHRPRSQFGHRPEPVLASVNEDNRESQYTSGRDSRAGMVNRNNTVLSRAGTLGRNGTLSRGANGGTIGNRRGAFGRGAGTTIGTQPEEVLGRE